MPSAEVHILSSLNIVKTLAKLTRQISQTLWWKPLIVLQVLKRVVLILLRYTSILDNSQLKIMILTTERQRLPFNKMPKIIEVGVVVVQRSAYISVPSPGPRLVCLCFRSRPVLSVLIRLTLPSHSVHSTCTVKDLGRLFSLNAFTAL